MLVTMLIGIKNLIRKKEDSYEEDSRTIINVVSRK